MRRYYIPILVPFLIIIHSCTNFQEEEVSATFGVSATQLTFPTSGDRLSVTVSSGTSWDVPSLPDWVSLQSITQSSLSPYEWTANFSASVNDQYNRQGTIIIKAGSEEAEISVTQEGEKGTYIAVKSISLSPTELTMTEGETRHLTAAIIPSTASDKSATWFSNNTSVATVSSAGVVTAKAVGEARVFVQTNDGGYTANSYVSVIDPKVMAVSLDKTSLSMKVGITKTLTATITPSYAKDKSVTWYSSNTSVASVSSSGVITAKAGGYTTITVKTNDGSKTATCSVCVVDYNGYKYADLGLPSGLKWATCNVGASQPEKYGDYYAWGETTPKDKYDWTTYKWCKGSNNTLTKYCDDSSYGFKQFTDTKNVLDYEDDAANVNLGGSWRMPTDEEWTELMNNCTWTWTQKNGVYGRIVTSKKNGNSIFLPAAGWRDNAGLNYVGSYGYYGSSSLHTDYPILAWRIRVSSGDVDRLSTSRYYGLSIRPVSE